MCDRDHAYTAGAIVGQGTRVCYRGSDAKRAVTALAGIRVSGGVSDGTARHELFGRLVFCPPESERIETAGRRLALLAGSARKADSGCPGCPCCSAGECAAESGCDHGTCPCWEGDTGPYPQSHG